MKYYVIALIFILTGVSYAEEVRTWTSKTGKFTTEASLQSISEDGQQAIIKKQDGKTITVPVDKLSDEDRAYLKQIKEEPQVTLDLIETDIKTGDNFNDVKQLYSDFTKEPEQEDCSDVYECASKTAGQEKIRVYVDPETSICWQVKIYLKNPSAKLGNQIAKIAEGTYGVSGGEADPVIAQRRWDYFDKESKNHLFNIQYTPKDKTLIVTYRDPDIGPENLYFKVTYDSIDGYTLYEPSTEKTMLSYPMFASSGERITLVPVIVIQDNDPKPVLNLWVIYQSAPHNSWIFFTKIKIVQKDGANIEIQVDQDDKIMKVLDDATINEAASLGITGYQDEILKFVKPYQEGTHVRLYGKHGNIDFEMTPFQYYAFNHMAKKLQKIEQRRNSAEEGKPKE